jgi:hypothetical protein
MIISDKQRLIAILTIPASIIVGLIVWGVMKGADSSVREINTIGLGCDFIGALLIALPLINPLKPGEKMTKLTMPTSEHSRLKEKKQAPWMIFGLFLLLLGFVLQLLANWI